MDRNTTPHAQNVGHPAWVGCSLGLAQKSTANRLFGISSCERCKHFAVGANYDQIDLKK
jgi:hypothetical protein